MGCQNNQVVVISLTILMLGVMSTWACSVMSIPTPEELVSKAYAIVRATALDYVNPPKQPVTRSYGPPDSFIWFRIEEKLKDHPKLQSSLTILGFLSGNDDFNDRESPYEFVRSNGRTGSCYAHNYKQGAEFLLFLNDKFTPYWSALAPVNEQLHLPALEDPWYMWVKKQLASDGSNDKFQHADQTTCYIRQRVPSSGSNRLRPFFY